MSSREPLWFCHECHSEMRPLMVPDPVCASCRSSFVEKMENPEDDPRSFAQGVDPDDLGPDAIPAGVDTFLYTLQSLMERGISQTPRSPRNNAPATGPRVTFEVRTGSGGSRVMSFGGSNTLGERGSDPLSGRPGQVPTMNEYIGRPSDNPQGGGTITGQMMAQYLMALLGQHDPLNPMFRGRFGMPENGRMGDYVFNEEALDQIITQIMENSNSHRPVPATEEIINNLPREVLTEGSGTLQKDCAVCKEQFKLETEDPDEQIIVTLPCKHPFHQPCITPWLKSSGTCPVCRHQLVPQPDHHAPPQASGGAGSERPRPDSPHPDRDSDHGGLLQALFGSLAGGGQYRRANSNSQRDENSNRGSGAGGSSSSSNNTHNNLPGGWTEDLD